MQDDFKYGPVARLALQSHPSKRAIQGFVGPASRSPTLHLVLGAQPLAEPVSDVAVHGPIGSAPPVPPAIAHAHTPRCPRTSRRPRPPLPCRPCSRHTHTPARPLDTPCPTARRTDSRALLSLWRAAPPATSEPTLEVVGSSPLSLALVASTPALNQGPFSLPALPGFLDTTGPSDTPHGPTSSSRIVG